MVAGSNYLNRLAGTMNFPATIPREELRRLLKRKRTIALAKGEYFLMAGDVPEYIGSSSLSRIRASLRQK